MVILYGVVAIYAALLVLGFFTNGFGGKGLVPFTTGVGRTVGNTGVRAGRRVARFHHELLFGAPPAPARPVAPFEK